MARKHDKDGATAKRDRALAAFDIDDPELPKAIQKAEFTAGGYPYDERLERKDYERHLRALQIELGKVQRWCLATGERIAIVFEGRDAAGKGSTIKRFTAYLNPRHARVVALTKPTETERGQWYFQRYVAHLPTAGEIVMFDRSWYNRAGVERVMGFAQPHQVADFLREAPHFEDMLVRDGIRFFKFFLTIGRETQLVRFHERRHNPLKRWKLSPIDIEALNRWDDYTTARDEMMRYTHTPTTPWTVLRANDKRRTRIAALQVVLQALPYTDKDEETIGTIDEQIVRSAADFTGER
ncbi:MAG: polyphosphate kinase 2 [Pseudomonadota bacterium]